MVERDRVALREKVRQSNDIVDVVSAYIGLKSAGRNLKGLCPFHNEKTPSFFVWPDKQTFKCFGCGAGGDVFTFVQLKENFQFPEALELLAQKAGIVLERGTGSGNTSDVSKTDLERVNRWASRWFQKQLAGSQGASAREYASSRSISDESITKFGLGYAPAGWTSLFEASALAKIPARLLHAAGLVKKREDGSLYDAFRDRLMFPIHDAMGRIIGFGGRALNAEDPAKYLNSPQSLIFDKSRAIYGIHAAREAIAQSREVILVEGYMDCLMCWQHGFHNVAATLGTAVTTEHVRLLRRYADRVFLVFDSDDAGRAAADRALQVFLPEQVDVRLAHVLEGKDPADILVLRGAEAFKAVLTSACEALEFKWKQVRRRYENADTGADRRRAIEDFLSLVAGFTNFSGCDPIQRGLVLNQVTRLLGLPTEEVHRQLRIVARRSAPVLGGVPQKQSAAPWNRSALETAMLNILEVLLADSSFAPSVSGVFDPNVFADEQTRQIASVVMDFIQGDAPWGVAQLMGRFDSVQMATRIVDLQLIAEQRGNYAGTIEGAMHRVESVRRRQLAGELVADLRDTSESRTAPDALSDDDAENSARQFATEKVQRIQEVVGKTNQFAGRKHFAASLAVATGSDSTEVVQG